MRAALLLLVAVAGCAGPRDAAIETGPGSADIHDLGAGPAEELAARAVRRLIDDSDLAAGAARWSAEDPRVLITLRAARVEDGEVGARWHAAVRRQLMATGRFLECPATERRAATLATALDRSTAPPRAQVLVREPGGALRFRASGRIDV